MLTTEDISENVYQLLLKLPKKNLINVMGEALENMQTYNSRSIQECILLALGGKYNENDNRWRMPSLRKIKEMTG